MVSLLALILSLPAAEAAQTLDSLLRRWGEADLLQIFEEADDGESDHQRGV